MSRKSKYHPLFEYLRHSSQNDVVLTFTEIEQLLGRALPVSARTDRAWWSNRSEKALQASSWMEAGYYVSNLDLENVQVKFHKRISKRETQLISGVLEWNGDLVKSLRLHANISQSQLALKLRVRQQTISDWENGIHQPNRSVSMLLTMIAEQMGFYSGG